MTPLASTANPDSLRSLLAPPALLAGVVASLLLGLPPALALLLGLATTTLLGNPAAALTASLAQQGIRASVVLLGFGLGLGPVLAAGARHALAGALSIAGILAAGLLLARLLRVERVLATLLSAGTAICGGSAIAAMAPVLQARPAQSGPAFALVFLLNGAALLLFPLVGHHLHLSQEAFGLWSALAIHDTSSVVGAASAYGDTALALALPIKLTRALWIIPLCLAAPLLLRRLSAPTTAVEAHPAEPARAPVPWFLLGFLAASLLATTLPAHAQLWGSLSSGGHALLSGALFLTGAGLGLGDLLRAGWRPAILAASLWLGASAVLLAVARILYP